jgi:hypothetical protein
MRWQLPLAACLCLLGTAGCANLNIKDPVEPAVTPSAGSAYLYGRFEEEKGWINMSSLWIRLEELETKATAEIQVQTGIGVFEVEPGTYWLKEFVIMAGGAPKSMLTKIDVQSAPIYANPGSFRVQAGHAYYLGNFHANSDSQYGLFENKLVNTLEARAEDFEKTTAEVRELYPGLSRLEFSRVEFEGMQAVEEAGSR